MSYGDCLDGPQGCEGEVFERVSPTGSGMAFPRCDQHYESYMVEALERIQKVRNRYPSTPPADFDPGYAGETW